MPLFEERRFYKINFSSHGYNIYCTYKVQKMPLFVETPVTIAKPNCNGYNVHVLNILCQEYASF